MNATAKIIGDLLKKMEESSQVRMAQPSPQQRELLDAAVNAIGYAVPTQFEHKGATYFLRLSIGMARVEVFEHAASPEPICRAIHSSFATHGHTPGH